MFTLYFLFFSEHKKPYVCEYYLLTYLQRLFLNTRHFEIVFVRNSISFSRTPERTYGMLIGTYMVVVHNILSRS